MIEIDDPLVRGAAKLGLSLSDSTQRRLLDYLALIEKWNRVYNLTAISGLPAMLERHLLDTLAIVPHLSAGSIVDVGSGAGVPGLPLAIVWPEVAVTALDSNQKKAAFLQQAAIELKLRNVTVACDRVETWLPPRKFDLVIARAFSDLAHFASVATRLCDEHGLIAAMKGIYPHEELAQLPSSVKLERVISLDVPELNEARHLVLLTPQR
jgi:16S rRNA (guanine527-N7)-methyltransferase